MTIYQTAYAIVSQCENLILINGPGDYPNAPRIFALHNISDELPTGMSLTTWDDKDSATKALKKSSYKDGNCAQYLSLYPNTIIYENAYTRTETIQLNKTYRANFKIIKYSIAISLKETL